MTDAGESCLFVGPRRRFLFTDRSLTEPWTSLRVGSANVSKGARKRRSNRRPRVSSLCIFIHPTTCRLWRPGPEALRSSPCVFKEALYAGSCM